MSAASRVRLFGLAGCAMLLCGCSSVGGFTGAVAALATGAATGNPIVGISVGIGVKAAADQGLQYLAKRNQADEHGAIVTAAQDLRQGETARWQNARFGPGYDGGEVRVVRDIETPLATCKELLFSVERDGAKPRTEWFTTTACRNSDGWRWAAAEPAVERWGNLQ